MLQYNDVYYKILTKKKIENKNVAFEYSKVKNG